MPDEKPEKHHLPRWAKRLLIALSIVGPLTGATVTAVDAYYNVKAKAKDASATTKASYATLAPAVKELQDLLSKALDASDAADREIVALKADRDDKEKRLIRLEAYVEILGARPNLPDAPPAVISAPKPATVAKVRKVRPPIRPVPKDVGGAAAYQSNRIDLNCAPDNPLCGAKP